MNNLNKTTNKLQGEIMKEIRMKLGEEEYRQRYVGDYKNHIRKVKGIFHNHKTGIMFHDQAYPNMMSFANPKSKVKVSDGTLK